MNEGLERLSDLHYFLFLYSFFRLFAGQKAKIANLNYSDAQGFHIVTYTAAKSFNLCACACHIIAAIHLI